MFLIKCIFCEDIILDVFRSYDRLKTVLKRSCNYLKTVFGRLWSVNGVKTVLSWSLNGL